MEHKDYYVAIVAGSFFNPTIVEKFNNPIDAGVYADLMSRTKKARYVVLEQKAEWDGTVQKNV